MRTTTDIKLATIVENLDKMPTKVSQYLGDDQLKLTKEEKQKLISMVGNYNEYGKHFDVAENIISTAKDLEEIVRLAETYAINESADWFQTEIIRKDFKDLRTRSKDFSKLAKETYSKMKQLESLFQDSANVLQKYYQINDLTPPLPKTNTDDEVDHRNP
jgi:hypothetical protein